MRLHAFVSEMRRIDANKLRYISPPSITKFGNNLKCAAQVANYKGVQKLLSFSLQTELREA